MNVKGPVLMVHDMGFVRRKYIASELAVHFPTSGLTPCWAAYSDAVEVFQ